MIIWLQFIACTALILFSGAKLSFYGDIIAEKTGLGRTWIGVVLMASVTSLPELITGVSSVAIFDLPNIAAGDVLGSCMFNMLIIAMLDFMNGSTPLSAREKRRIGEFVRDVVEEARYAGVTKTRAYTMYGLNALVIIVAASYLPHVGERIAEVTGLGNTSQSMKMHLSTRSRGSCWNTESGESLSSKRVGT